MMNGFSWVLSVIVGIFGLFDTLILGVPMYAYLIFAFIMGLVANFIQGRR